MSDILSSRNKFGSSVFVSGETMTGKVELLDILNIYLYYEISVSIEFEADSFEWF